MTEDEESTSGDEFKTFMLGLAEHLGMPAEQPMRTWDTSTTTMGEIPDDLTVAESQVLFGTPYDESTHKLKGLLDMMGAPPGTFEHLLQHVAQLTMPVFKVNDSDTIDEAMPKGIIIDLVTVGILAHHILGKIDFQGAGVMKMSDLLNGKGPFDE